MATRFKGRLSAYFYSYGKQWALRPFTGLFITMALVSWFSWPMLARFWHSLSGMDLIAPIPPDQVDAEVWRFSPFVQSTDISSTRHIPRIIIQQIGITLPDQSVTKDLLLEAVRLENTLRTTTVQVLGKTRSLSSICFSRHDECVVHSPSMYWKGVDELKADDAWADTMNQQRNTQSSLSGHSKHPVSVLGGVTLNPDGEWMNANSVIVTVFLVQNAFDDTQRIWDAIWQKSAATLDIVLLDTAAGMHGPIQGVTAFHKQVNDQPQALRFQQPTFWPAHIPQYTCLYLFVYLIVFHVVSTAFKKSHFVKSSSSFGFAAVFVSLASVTITCTVMDWMGIELHAALLYLLPIVASIATIENNLLLTNAVISAGCDMDVKEKVARGLESIGLPMTGTLCAELVILAIGARMDIALVKDFCIFTQVALIIEHVLQLTFFLAVLSIDIRRVELADLDDGQMTKRIRALSNCDMDVDQSPDYCPIQDAEKDETAKTCAECKDLKSHRTMNALLLCLVLLTLSFFRVQIDQFLSKTFLSSHVPRDELVAVSHAFWQVVNPDSTDQALETNPLQLVMLSPDPVKCLGLLQNYHERNAAKIPTANTLLPKSTDQRFIPTWPTSRCRTVVYAMVSRIYAATQTLNIPSILLSLVLITIIMWLIPRWRNQWLIPFLKWNSASIRARSVALVSTLVAPLGSWVSRNDSEYNADGVHVGAISAQQQFNVKHQSMIKRVHVKTLSGKHISDIRCLGVNAKRDMLVSCGEDGHIILWDTERTQWMARLDRMHSSLHSSFQCELNSHYYRNATHGKKLSQARYQQRVPLTSVRSAQIDAGNKWIASGFANGVIRVWDISRGVLVRELGAHMELPTVEQEGVVRRRRRGQDDVAHPSERGAVDRVIALQFIGAVAEYCHPLVAEAAARIRTASHGSHSPSHLDSSQNYIVSVHKSGIIREWDVASGECIQSIRSGHVKDITLLHVVECRPPHLKLGVTWIFTASKGGVVKCWERRLDKTSDDDQPKTTRWTCVYTLDGHGGHAISALSTEFPVGGMGILVTGSVDGAVKVWSFESGEHVCVLSTGGIKQRHPEVHVGGPLLQFSKMGTTTPISREDRAGTRHLQDHRGAITQVTVTRYCEVENGPGICRGCDTCFGNGFLIASSAMDETVHVWRLERSDSGHEHNCTLCSKDYHRQQYKRGRKTAIPTNDASERKTRPHRETRRVIRRTRTPRPTQQSEWADGFLDIEQLAGDGDIIELVPTFLGKIDQLAGRGLVFCNNMVLAGVRRRQDEPRGMNGWEAWFASLQYFEPPEVVQASSRIPVKTFLLDAQSTDREVTLTTTATIHHAKSAAQHRWYGLGGFFGKEKANERDNIPVSDLSETAEDEEMDEANELLPFSTVRHVVSLDGMGLACEFGNFIKLVYLDEADKKQHNTLQSRTMLHVDACSLGKDCCTESNHALSPQALSTASPIRPASPSPTTANAACSERNLADCSKLKCSRASDCTIAAQAKGRRLSTSLHIRHG